KPARGNTGSRRCIPRAITSPLFWRRDSRLCFLSCSAPSRPGAGRDEDGREESLSFGTNTLNKRELCRSRLLAATKRPGAKRHTARGAVPASFRSSFAPRYHFSLAYPRGRQHSLFDVVPLWSDVR